MPVDVRSRADIFAEMDKIAAEVEEQQRKRFAEMDKIAEMTGFKVPGAEESLPKPIEQRKLPEGADIITLPLHERASQIKKVDERTQPSSEYVKALTAPNPTEQVKLLQQTPSIEEVVTPEVAEARRLLTDGKKPGESDKPMAVSNTTKEKSPGMDELPAWTAGKAFKGGIADLFGRYIDVTQMNTEEIGHTANNVPVEDIWAKKNLTDAERAALIKATQGYPEMLEDLKRSRGETEKSLKGWQEYFDPGMYSTPESLAGQIAHDFIRNSPYTLAGMVQSAPISILGGPLGGIISGLASGANEAQMERAEAYKELHKRGKPHKEAYDQTDQMNWQNMGLLSMSDAIQNILTFSGNKLFPNMGKLKRGLFAIGGDMAMEGAEEGGQKLISNKALGDENDWGEIGYEALLGGLSGGLFGAGGMGVNYIGNKLAGKQPKQEQEQQKPAGVPLDELVGKIKEDLKAQEQSQQQQEAQKNTLTDEKIAAMDEIARQAEQNAETQEQNSVVKESLTVQEQQPEAAKKKAFQERGELLKWAKGELDSMTEAAKFADDESNTADNALTEEDLRRFHDIKEARKRHDYETLARMRDEALARQPQQIPQPQPLPTQPQPQQQQQQPTQQQPQAYDNNVQLQEQPEVQPETISKAETVTQAKGEAGAIEKAGETRDITDMKGNTQRVTLAPKAWEALTKKIDKLIEEFERSLSYGDEAFESSLSEIVSRGETFRPQTPEQRKKLGSLISEAKDRLASGRYEGGRATETTTQAPVEITQEVTPTVGQSGLSNIQPNHIGDVNEMAGSAEQQQPQAIQSPEKSDTKRGKQSKVVTPAGDNVETVFKLAEADDLIASNKSNFELNEKYPQELQPRQRGRMASQQQIEGIISKLNPELLGESTLASDGAPIVGSDNVVESGNGRVLALKLMYERGGATAAQAAKYKQYLVDNAEKFGLSADEVNSMKRPVMVRERTSEIDRKAFTQNANVSNMAAMSSSEMAARDAGTLNNETLGLINPDTDILSNREFIKEFAREVVQQNERGTFMDERGNISQDGLRRITNALFMKAYGDNRTLARMGEAVDDNTRNINKALLQAAPTIAQMQEKIKQGTLKADLSLAPHVVEAVNKLSQLRAEGKKVAEFLSERSLFNDNEISPEAREILKFLDKNKQRPNVITNFLLDTARAIENEGNPDQLKLFDTKDSSLYDIVNEMAEKHKTQRAAESPRLFDQKETPEETHRRVHGDIKEQLIKTGMKEEEATANADILTAGLEASAKRESSGLGDFYKKLKLTFTKDSKDGQTYAQIAYTPTPKIPETAEGKQAFMKRMRNVPPTAWTREEAEQFDYYMENVFDPEEPATWGLSKEELAMKYGLTRLYEGYDIDNPDTWGNERGKQLSLLSEQLDEFENLPPEIEKAFNRMEEIEKSDWADGGKRQESAEYKKLEALTSDWTGKAEAERDKLWDAEDNDHSKERNSAFEIGMLFKERLDDRAASVPKLWKSLSHPDNQSLRDVQYLIYEAESKPVSEWTDKLTARLADFLKGRDELVYWGEDEHDHVETNGMFYFDSAMPHRWVSVEDWADRGYQAMKLQDAIEAERDKAEKKELRAELAGLLKEARKEEKALRKEAEARVEAEEARFKALEEKFKEAGGETFYQTASKDVDREYFAALEAGDMETVQRIVDEQAAKMEYSSDSGYRMNHKAPNREYGVNIPGLKGSDLVPEDYWTHPNYYQSDAEEYESFRKVKMALNSNIGVIRMYRAVPKNIKESSFRNGDWITPSRAYAELEGQGIVEGYRIITQSVKTKDVWWDGNSICEFGYDDGSSYAYRDTKNNRKLTDAVVKDEDGQVVPPSKRFNLRKAETFYQTAWHGSPHRFDGFDISKIGTGEGAQVYGWGLYFAQSRDIADSHYRKRLVNEAKAAPDVYWNGEKLVSKSFGWGSTEISTEDRIIMALSKNNYDIDRAAKSAKEHLEKLLADKTPDEHAALKEEIQKERSVVEALESGAVTVESRIDENETGQLYKVDVPEDDVLLDYDKPFPEQTQFVKDALQPFIDKYIETEGRVGIGVDYLYATGKEIQEAIASNLRDGNILEDGTIPADKVKNNLKIDRKSKEVSVFLKNIGIVGVKYLDGNSRSKGKGSYNFVVFDDKAIQMLETFYQSSMLNDETLLQYDKNSAEWINAVSQLIENASDEGYTHLYLRAMVDENNADHNHVKGERLEESRYWGDMLSEEEEESGEREDVTLGGTSTIFIDEDLSGNPEDWAAELYKKINAASNYAGPLAIVGVNEDMDNAEGIMYRHSFSGEDKYEQVLPNARFYGYVHELLGEAFKKEKKYVQTQQKQDGEVKGSITLPGKLGSAPVNINLTKLSDPSTAPHEMGHLFLWILENQAREQTGNAEIQTALQAVKDFVGRKSDEASFSDNQHEKFANGFMTYVSEGKAPNSRLEKAFKQFKKWLADLWDSLTGNPKVKLTLEIRKVFDWLLTGDAAFDVRYDLDNAIERAQELNGKTYFQVTVEPRQRDTSNDTRMMDMVNSPNIVAERHARFRPFFRMAKEAYQQQEAMRGNWQRAADGIFGRNGFFGRKGGIIQTDAQRETLTEILLQGDALETVFTDAELQNLGADTDVVRAYRRIRSLYDNTHRLVSAQRQRYGRDAMAYREGYVPHFFHTWRVIRDGQILNTFRSMREAVRAANELQDSEGGDYRVVPAMHDFQGQDQLDAVIMGDRAYLRLLHNFEEAFGMDARTAQLLLQNVARRQPRSRFFGNALQRRGIDGWDTNMEYALRHYLNFSARYIAMDTLKHDGINLFERAFGRFRSEHTGLAHYTKKYLEAALGNPSNVEETLNNWIRESWLGQYIRDYIGDRPATMAANTLAKGIAVSKLGFLNMTTAAMNITQLIGTNAIIGERYTVRGIREYLRPNAHTRAVYRALGIEESMNLESPSGYSRAHNMAGLLGDASMGAFRLLDSMARKVTVIGAYRRGIDQGMNHAAAIEYARQVNDDVNFDYSVADSPHFMRQSGPIGTLLFQFKKYPIKMMELALPGVGKLRGMQQVRFWVPFLAMTGLFGLPGFDALKEWIKAMFSGKDIELEVKKFIGTSKMPQRLKDTILYGAFANLGVDVGKRTGMGDFIPADIGDLTGPTISTIGQLMTAIPKIFDNGNFMDTIEAISPGLANPLKAWLGETRDRRRGRLQFEYEGMGEKTARTLGARPLREAKERDAARIADYEQRKRSDAEQDAIDNFIRIYSKGNTQSAEYEKARARLGELRIDPARVKREMSAKNLSGYDRKLKQYTTKKGYQNMQMMQQYMGK